MAPTNTEGQKAKPGPSPIKMADGRGLYLLVSPAGSKLWRWKYRFLDKEKLMAIGACPDVSLAQARDTVDEARKELATGPDPMDVRKFEVYNGSAVTRVAIKLLAISFVRTSEPILPRGAGTDHQKSMSNNHTPR